MNICGNLQYPNINAADLIDRLKEVCDSKTDRHLAEKIGVKDEIFSRWRSRNTYHEEVVLAVAYAKGVSINYLLFGQSEPTISVELTLAELEVVKTICKDQGLTEAGLIRFAVRLYEEVCARFANGERIEFKREGRSSAVLITPMLSVLRARHAPRKPRR